MQFQGFPIQLHDMAHFSPPHDDSARYCQAVPEGALRARSPRHKVGVGPANKYKGLGKFLTLFHMLGNVVS